MVRVGDKVSWTTWIYNDKKGKITKKETGRVVEMPFDYIAKVRIGVCDVFVAVEDLNVEESGEPHA